MLERVIRETWACSPKLRVATGNIRCDNIGQTPSPSDAAPEVGSHLKYELNTRMKTSPQKNSGTETAT